METSSYVGLSGQLALERRLATIAHNIANAGTSGFRAEGVQFSSIVSPTAPFRTAFATTGAPFAETRAGGLTQSGNPLDVAVQGDGFFAVATPQGVAYTRDGRMQMLPTGDLVSTAGYPMLDISGSPLTVNPAGGTISVLRDGMIQQDGRNLGAIGLFKLDLSKGYTRTDNAGLVPAVPAEPVDDFIGNGVVQGYVEESNVNPILEMTNLIAVQRAFEALNGGLEQRDQALRDAIQTLGQRAS